MMNEERSVIPNMEPRDVLTPIATLIGLLAAALGLIVGANLEKSLFQILINTIVIITLSFVVTAVLTTLGSLTRKTSLWNWALAIYAVSWIIFGMGFVGILMVFAYGPSVFRITIPPIYLTTDLLSLFLPIAAGILSMIVYELLRVGIRKLFRNITRLRIEMPGITLAVERQAKDEISAERDTKMAFLKRVIEVEKLLREVASSKGIDIGDHMLVREIARKMVQNNLFTRSQFKNFEDVWELRNKVVHGFDVPDDIVEAGLEATIAYTRILYKLSGRLNCIFCGAMLEGKVFCPKCGKSQI